MKVFRTVLIIIISITFLVAGTLFLIGYFRPKPAGILAKANIESSVYINGNLVGKTPFTQVYKPGEILLKMVPIDTSQNLLPFETKVTLISGIQTVVRREFGKTEDESSGDVISFDKDPGKTSLIIVSNPDNSQISLDGVPRGFAPYKTSLVAGEHQITIKSPGYTDHVMTVKTLNGYRLAVSVKLAKFVESPKQDQVTPEQKVFIEILKTPTGFLRVRDEPGSKGHEFAEVKPVDRYQYLATDTETGWYEIQYQEPQAGLPDGIKGWITNEFSTKVDSSTDSGTLSQ